MQCTLHPTASQHTGKQTSQKENFIKGVRTCTNAAGALSAFGTIVPNSSGGIRPQGDIHTAMSLLSINNSGVRRACTLLPGMHVTPPFSKSAGSPKAANAPRQAGLHPLHAQLPLPDQAHRHVAERVLSSKRGTTCMAHCGGSPRGGVPRQVSEWKADTRAMVVTLPLVSRTSSGSIGRRREGRRTMTVMGPMTYTCTCRQVIACGSEQ